jgi:hypothetical protein
MALLCAGDLLTEVNAAGHNSLSPFQKLIDMLIQMFSQSDVLAEIPSNRRSADDWDCER